MVIEPEDLPEHAGKQKVLIGEDVSERLDVIPAKFRVIVTRRRKYAFKGGDGVIQALPPAHIIEVACRRRRCWADRGLEIRRRPAALSPGVDLCP